MGDLLPDGTKNPLPPGVLQALKVAVPRPRPDLFTKADYDWLKRRVASAMTAAAKAPGAKTVLQFTQAERSALHNAMVVMSISVATRTLQKYYAEIDPKFDHVHTHTCGLWGAVSADRTRMDQLQFRIESLEKALIAAGKK